MTDPAEPFEKMASDIRHGAAYSTNSEFAGGIVIVPPGDAEPIAFHTWAAKPNTFQFWTNLKSLVEEACAAAQADMVTKDPWGRR